MKPSDLLKFCKKYSPVPLVKFQLEILDGIFKNRFCIIVEPSGWGKTLKSGLHVAACMVGSKKRIRSFAIAGDLAQAGLLHQALVDIFQHEDLRRLVHETSWTLKLRHAPKSVHETLATSPSTVWGITPAILTVDELSEATAQSERNFFAAVSALRKDRDSKLAIFMSPGLRDTTAHRIVGTVRGDPKWFVVELTDADHQPPWLDSDSEGVYDALLPPEIREAKHAGRWADPGGGVVDRGKLDNMSVDAFSDMPGTDAYGVDLALTRAQAAVAHLRRVGSLYYILGLHVWEARRGEKIDLVEIQDEIRLMNERRPAPVIFDPWQSQLMMQQLRKQGVQVKEFTFTTDNRKKLFSRVLDLIESGRLKTRPHPELKKQLLGLSVKRLPSGGWRIDHRPNQKDDLIIAVALALQGLPETSGDYKPEAHGQRIAAAHKTSGLQNWGWY